MIDASDYYKLVKKERAPDRDEEHLEIQKAVENEYGEKVCVIESHSSISDRTKDILVEGLYNRNANFQWDGDLEYWTIQLSAFPAFLMFCSIEVPYLDVRYDEQVARDYIEAQGNKLINREIIEEIKEEMENQEASEAKESGI